MGFAERRGEIVARLSGGNQQRINIAIGLLSRPAVLLLDEPSVGLDPRQRARLWEFIAGLAGQGTSVVFSTHDIQEAERYGQRCSCSRTARACSTARRGSCAKLCAARLAEGDFETAFISLPPPQGALASARGGSIHI